MSCVCLFDLCRLRGLVLAVVLVAACGFASPVTAELLVHEPFDYPAGGQLIGMNGGAGFTSAWRTENFPNSATIQNGSIAYPGLPTTGNSVLMTGLNGSLQIFRDHTNIAGADGTQTWLSFVAQRLGPIQDPAANPNNPFPRGVNISFYNTEGFAVHGREQFAVGNATDAPTNNWAFIGHGQPANILAASTPAVAYGGAPAAFVVVRIDHHGPPNVDGPGNNDDVYLFINPDATTEPPSTAPNAQRLGTEPNSFDYSGLDYVRPFIGNNSGGRPYGDLLLDELRIGTSYFDVSVGGTGLLSGDTDEDGIAGEYPDDFLPIRNNFQKAVAARTSGDLVNDDIVDFRDFRQWKTAFVAGGGALADVDVSFAEVPEPSAWVLGVLAGAAFVRRRAPLPRRG
jgi:hypothetical protein